MALKASELKVGDSYEAPLVEDLKRTQIVMYAGASGDYNPVHTDELFVTEAAGYPTVFAHGMLSMGFVAQALTDWAGAGTVRRLGVRFAALVRLKDTVTCGGRVLAKTSKDDRHLVDLEVWAENQRGEKVVTGRATLALPSRG